MELTSTWLAHGYELPAHSYVRRRAWSGWETAASFLIASFLAAQLVLIAVAANGPTLDESIYITSGLRTLEGRGVGDGYLGWFAGSLLWPALAGLGDEIAGLAGARAFTAMFITIAVAATWRAAVCFFDPRAGFFTAALAVASGPVLSLGHLAVIDAPAVAGIAVSLWGVGELGRTGHRKWLGVAAVAFSLGVLSKYPSAACGVALLLAIAAQRRRQAVVDLVLFGLITLAVLITYFVCFRSPIIYFFDWRVENNPTFGYTTSMVAFQQVWYGGLPVPFALGGWALMRRKLLGAALLLGAVPFPLYALLSGSAVGGTKHVVFGFMFILPLAGYLLSRLSRWPAGAVVAAVAVMAAGVFGVRQAEQLERGWVDVEPAADFLATKAKPGQDFLIDNSWPFIQHLYEDGKVRSPWAVYDAYRVQHGQLRKPVCRVDWFVAAQGAAAWSDRFRRRVQRCGTFRRVFHQASPANYLGPKLRFITYEAGVEIYRNVGRGRSG